MIKYILISCIKLNKVIPESIIIIILVITINCILIFIRIKKQGHEKKNLSKA